MKKTVLTLSGIIMAMSLFANEPEDVNHIPQESTATEATEATEEYYYERRFSSITELGTSINYSKPYFSVYQAVGINVNHHFFVGQGIGLQVADNRLLQLQATADFRAYVLDRNVTPMFVVQAGLNKVSKAPENEIKQLNDMQFMLNAGTGVLWQAKPNAAFTLNGGYTLCTDFKASMHGGFVKVGYVF